MYIILIVVVLIATAFVVGLVVPAVTPPISWLPETGEARALLGTLLTAQAAIAALTLAVTLFVMQGVSARRDADDRTYREYVRRSWVRQIFWSSLIAVGATGAVLLIEGFVGASEAVATAFPALRNLALLPPVAFLANLVLAAILFERAVRLAQPEHWRAIRRHVNERDVREAVQVFLKRFRSSQLEGQIGYKSDLFDAIPDAGEGSASDAIQALLGDGRRAMDERRPREFARSLNSIKELLEYALREVEEVGIGRDTPFLPSWPPLRELRNNIDSFREEVILRGDQYHVSELLNFDHWAVTSGTSRGSEDLLRVGLDGYASNYQIATRIGDGEFLESFFDRIWGWPYPTFSNAHPRDVFPYIREEMMLYQERLLSEAMQAGRPTDYGRIHNRFEVFLRALGRYWEYSRSRWQESEELYERLEEHYRITLIGLGGRALLLADSGRIADSNSYTDVVREAHPHLGALADDVAKAVAGIEAWKKTRWMDWEMEGAENMELRKPIPHQYPLTWFTFRLMELSAEPNQTLDLHGSAWLALRWFEKDSVRLAVHLSSVPAPTIEKRREYATAALRAAARKDDVAHDYEIIRYDLSDERISAFEAEVYTAALASNSIERLFERAGACVDLQRDSEAGPDECRIHGIESKVFLADVSETAGTPYPRLDGGHWGRLLSGEVIKRFCETLGEAPQTTAFLNTPEALLRQIEGAVEGLDPAGELVIVLAGDWSDVLTDLSVNQPDGYQLSQQNPEDDQAREIARYNGHPILRGPACDDRRLYIVELEAWGSLVRAKTKGDRVIVVKVNPVSAERARALLDSDPQHFVEEPDETSKLRKLKTCVEITVSARAEFRITDPSRARRIVSVH